MVNEFQARAKGDIELIWYTLEILMNFVPPDCRAEIHRMVSEKKDEIKNRTDIELHALKCLDKDFEKVMNRLGYFRE